MVRNAVSHLIWGSLKLSTILVEIEWCFLVILHNSWIPHMIELLR